MDHWVFEGKSSIAVIYRRESLWMGQLLSKNSDIQPVNMAHLRRASLPSSGQPVSLSCHAAAFPGAFFGLCNTKENVFSNSGQSYIFSYYWCSADDGLVQHRPASEFWHLKLPTQEHFISIISSANLSLRQKRPVGQSSPFQCSNIS